MWPVYDTGSRLSRPRRQSRGPGRPAREPGLRAPRNRWESTAISFSTAAFQDQFFADLIFALVICGRTIADLAQASQAAESLQLVQFVHANGAEDHDDRQFLGFGREDKHAARFAVDHLHHDVSRFAALYIALVNDGRPLRRFKVLAQLVD